MKEGWTYKKLVDLCTIRTGKRDANHAKEDGAYRFYTCAAQYVYCDTYSFDGDCLILPGNGANVGDVYMYSGKFDAYQRTYVLSNINREEIYFKYLYYFFLGNWRRKGTANQYGTATNYIIMSNFTGFTIGYPTLSEQQHIAEELDLLSSIIEKKKAQLNELDNMSQSLFYEMFGDPITNEKGWEVKKIGEITDSSIGITYKPTAVNDDGVIVLRSSNIQNNEIDLKDIVRVNCKIKDDKFVRNGDILMCTRNGSFRLVGKVAMINNLPERMTYGAFMTVIRSQYNVFLFMFFQLPAFRQQLTTAQTATINQITVKMLNEVKVIFPPIDLQQQFASKIEAIKHEKELIKQSIKEVTSMYNSRLDFWFNLNK